MEESVQITPTYHDDEVTACSLLEELYLAHSSLEATFLLYEQGEKGKYYRADITFEFSELGECYMFEDNVLNEMEDFSCQKGSLFLSSCLETGLMNVTINCENDDEGSIQGSIDCDDFQYSVKELRELITLTFRECYARVKGIDIVRAQENSRKPKRRLGLEAYTYNNIDNLVREPFHIPQY